MKLNKKIICLVLVFVFMLPFVLTGCSDSGDVTTGRTTKPLTFTLYGITGEGTTEEAIKAVEDAMNVYTEGKFNTHIILRLYPESEYYNVLESKLAEIQKRLADEKAEADRKKREAAAARSNNDGTTAAPAAAPETTAAPETDADTYVEHGVVKSVFPEEKNTQVDIFMVRSAGKVQQYFGNGWVAPLNEQLSGSFKVLNTYISKQRLSLLSLEGKALEDGTVEKGFVYGIPNNGIVEDDYTYLLIRKEIADRFYYSPSDVDTLAELEYFLIDAARDYPDYITLYNDPVIGLDYVTDEPSLLGGIVTQTTNAFTRTVPRDILTIPTYRTYLQYRYDWRAKDYTVNGDYYSAPSDGKTFAAAFLRGDSTLPEEYKDDYYVINYLNPIARADEFPGTTFCVSSYASNVDRCMEIISSLQTNTEFRDTFQYGVNGVNYEIDEITGLVKYLNHDYVMDPADTGNMFIMTPNEEMSERVLSLAANGWEKAKKEMRDVIVSPYCMFDYRIITADNYKTTSRVWAKMYSDAYEEAKKAENFDPSKFVFDKPYPGVYTQDIIDKLVEVGVGYREKVESFVEYVDENGVTVTISDYAKTVRNEFEKEDMYVEFSNIDNIDAPYTQYTTWYSEYGIKEEN